MQHSAQMRRQEIDRKEEEGVSGDIPTKAEIASASNFH